MNYKISFHILCSPFNVFYHTNKDFGQAFFTSFLANEYNASEREAVMQIQGNITALVTPMKRNGNVDFDKLGKIIEFQINNGARGLVVLGSTGEAFLLSEEEKDRAFEFCVDKVQKRVPIIAGINAFCLFEALMQVQKRVDEGADANLVSPPPYIKPSSEGVELYFNEIAKASHVPVIIYNNPSRTGVGISLDVVKKLAEKDNIVGIKEASGDMAYAEKVSRLISDDFSLICGNDNLFLQFLALGCKSIISVAGNIMPEFFNAITEEYDQNPQKSKRIYNKYASVVDALSLESNPIMIKYVMGRLGMIKPYLRAPLGLPSRRNRNKIKKILSEI